jgi:hypothetical protein
MQVQGVKRTASNKALLYSLINRIKVGCCCSGVYAGYM